MCCSEQQEVLESHAFSNEENIGPVDPHTGSFNTAVCCYVANVVVPDGVVVCNHENREM